MRLFVCFCAMMILPVFVQARPVSYPGGITLLQSNNTVRNSLNIHYSPTARYSVGYLGEYWRELDWQFHGVQVNHLLKRWNKPAAQANVYLNSGLGFSVSQDNGDGVAAFTGIALDWENRRFFTAYKNRFYSLDNTIDSFFSQQYRVGVVPYIGDYGDLHTWLIFQVDHRPQREDSITNTAVLRFLKNVYLIELGIDDDSDPLVNFIYRF